MCARLLCENARSTHKHSHAYTHTNVYTHSALVDACRATLALLIALRKATHIGANNIVDIDDDYSSMRCRLRGAAGAVVDWCGDLLGLTVSTRVLYLSLSFFEL